MRTLKGRDFDVLVNIEFPKTEDYSRVLISLLDISERKRAEKQLKENEEAFRTLSHAIPALVLVADADGTITYLNDYVNNYNGAEKRENGSWSLRGMIHEDDYDFADAMWDEAVAKGETYQMEYRIRMKDGNYRWHIVRAVPMKDGEGKVIRWFGSATDIHSAKEYSTVLENDVKERTAELYATNQVLKQSNQELEHFAHIVSHDLREPVRKLALFVDLIFKDHDTVLSERARQYQERVFASIYRMESMIKGVLDYSMLSGTDVVAEEIDLMSVMQHIELDLELNITHTGAVLQYQDLPKIKGSSIMIYQLFFNLINNSLKFIQEGRRPVIGISEVQIQKEGMSYHRITVKDNGIGFLEKHATKIFDSFSRLHPKDRYEGTGLGLSLCKKIVLRHQGTIEAFGKLNEGARFIIDFPA